MSAACTGAALRGSIQEGCAPTIKAADTADAAETRKQNLQILPYLASAVSAALRAAFTHT